MGQQRFTSPMSRAKVYCERKIPILLMHQRTILKDCTNWIQILIMIKERNQTRPHNIDKLKEEKWVQSFSSSRWAVSAIWKRWRSKMANAQWFWRPELNSQWIMRHPHCVTLRCTDSGGSLKFSSYNTRCIDCQGLPERRCDASIKSTTNLNLGFQRSGCSPQGWWLSGIASPCLQGAQ